MSGPRVNGWGRRDARLVLIGEAPGPHECRLGEPFVGPSGALLFGGAIRSERVPGWACLAGLKRTDFRIENCCEYMPPQAQAWRWDRGTWEAWFDDLHQRLAELDDPWVLVPTGNYALYALTGKGKVPWHTRDGQQNRPGILDWRGSILSYTDRRGRTLKVIPTPHPAATFRDPSLEAICRRDWERIAEESHTREIGLPQRTHLISPTAWDVVNFLGTVTEETVLSFDIENPENEKGEHPIVCIGLSIDPAHSLTVPTTKSYWKDQETLDKVWAALKITLESNIPKITFNNFHEQYWLFAERGITIGGDMWDVMYLHHALDASAPHSLAFCASVDTRQPFWKSMAKDEASWRAFAKNEAAFFTYCGLDACVTRELFDVYYQRLELERRSASTGPTDGLDFYARHYAACFEPLLALCRTGIRVDERRQRARYEELRAEVAQIHTQITAAAGRDLYGKKSLSNAKLKAWLYDDLKLPVQTAKRAKGERTASAGEVAIRKLMRRYPEQLGTVGPLILDYRRKDKLSEFYLPQRIDADGYFRSSYGLNTEAGRLQSKANPQGTGSNAQNVDREARDMFLADVGHLGVEVDLSQAEARLVYLAIASLTGDQSIRDAATARPDEYDQHTDNAALIFGIDKSAVTKEQRYLGKKTVHGAQRDLHGLKFSEELLKDGYFYSQSECQEMLDAYHARVPGLQEYFRWVRGRIISDHYCENHWGRRLHFTYDRLGDETYRRGYSFYPQSDCADHMNQKGLVPLHHWFNQQEAHTGDRCGRINVHGHDALLFSVLPERAYDATKVLVESLESPYSYWGVEFSMPVEVKCGLSWKGSHEWKRMPTRSEFEEVVHELVRGL